jgi:hypothetical protein
MGEQLAADEFRVLEFSFSRRRGSVVSFTRNMRSHQSTLETFFRKTGRDFRRFNYLGEWHSHPNFPVTPSSLDMAAMQAIVNDRRVGATFATLLIVRLCQTDMLEIGPYLFVPGERLPFAIECVLQPDQDRPSDRDTRASICRTADLACHSEPAPIPETDPAAEAPLATLANQAK